MHCINSLTSKKQMTKFSSAVFTENVESKLYRRIEGKQFRSR